MRGLRQHLRSRRGQTLVEFALLAPILLIFIAAIIDFGMTMDRRLVLQHAAREGARAAAVNADIGAVCDRIEESSQGTVDIDDVTFEYEDLDGNAQYNAGDNVKVTLPYEWDLPFIGTAMFGLFGDSIGPIDLTATGSARLERVLPGEENCQ
jgi:hypothetical protein